MTRATSRPVRRRGMKPLVTAVVADATGTMEATFFNQPWLQRRYGPGTRLLLSGKYQARNRFRVQFHAETGEEVGAASDEMATYPATDGLSTTQILALARQWRGAAQVISLEIPLAQAGAPELCRSVEEIGFFFSGLGPYFKGDGDALLLQLLDTELDISLLQIADPFARELVGYVARERDRIRRP